MAGLGVDARNWHLRFCGEAGADEGQNHKFPPESASTNRHFCITTAISDRST